MSKTVGGRGVHVYYVPAYDFHRLKVVACVRRAARTNDGSCDKARSSDR